MQSTLEAVARYHLQAPVAVLFQPLAWPQLGEANYGTGGIAQIVLADTLPLTVLGFVFFHELAHHVLGHVPTPAGILVTGDRVAKLCTIFPDSVALERLYRLANVASVEEEANAWAEEQLSAFERAFGPFAAAMG